MEGLAPESRGPVLHCEGSYPAPLGTDLAQPNRSDCPVSWGSDNGMELSDTEHVRDTLNDGNNNETGGTSEYHEHKGRSLRIRSKRKVVPEKVRHKRQTLQDMARPLKKWLYHHRENPYPSKSEKVALAAGSHMTLMQVSNWFANARRRLKNTVRSPNLSWSARIKLYNNFVVGNAELFSVSSDDSLWDSEEENGDQINETFPTDQSEAISEETHRAAVSEDLVPSRANTPTYTHGLRAENVFNYNDDFGSHLKYKNTILQRYLNDHYDEHHVHLDDGELPQTRGRRQSGSLGSRDYEEMSTSSASSPLNDAHHGVFDDFTDEMEVIKKRRITEDDSQEDDEMYWKKIDAALALTNLARASQRP